MSKSGIIVALAVLFATFGGCGRRTGSISSEYGNSSGLSGRTSINGFGALRKTYEQANFDTRDIYRLTDRLARSQVIVWTPQTSEPIAGDVTRWFDKWLRRDGRTLVYIMPDSGSEAQYWVEASRLAPPKQRLEYRRRAARSVNQRMQWTVNRRPMPSNGWFNLVPSTQISRADKLTGPWKPASPTSPDESEIRTDFQIVAYDPDSPPPNPNNWFPTGPTTPTVPSYVSRPATKPTSTPVDFQSVLNSEAGETIIAEITSTQWGQSKVIAVASGSLLTNYAFAKQQAAPIAEQIVSHSAPVIGSSTTLGTAGFLTSNGPIPISEPNPDIPRASGMELLTTWPISLVTIHAALLGFVVCMMLLPLFGRPRKVDRGTTSNFGDHLDAVAALMMRTGGERFAKLRISEYMRRMHGETQGKWILPETADESHAARPLSLDRHQHVGDSPAAAPTTELESARAMDNADPSLPSSSTRDQSRWTTESSENPASPPTESTDDDEAMN